MNRSTGRSFLILLVVLVSTASRCTSKTGFLSEEVGNKAYELTKELVALGPRAPGTPGIEKARKWISSTALANSFKTSSVAFKAQTPVGEVEMKNLFYTIPGTTSEKKVILVAHYDSKRFVSFNFVGANDSASTVALLLAISPQIAALKLPFDVQVLFVDGEEALAFWNEKDSLYGSREFVSKLKSPSSVKAVLVIDMIGDSDLQFVDNPSSDTKLRSLMKEVLKEAGREELLEATPMLVEDDHLSFVRAGIPTLHIMDFTYGGKESPGKYWHKAEDTLDKISPESLAIVSELILRMLPKLG